MIRFDLVLSSLRQRKLSAILTTLSVALGVMLVTAILVLRADLEETFERPGKGYSLVVGPAKGSPLAIVLNTIYHLDQSPGLMPWSAFQAVEEHPYCRHAVPIAVGDSFKGHRVVATTDAIFAKEFPHPAGEGQEKFQTGRPFKYSKKELFEAFDNLPGQRNLWAPDAPRGHVHGTEEAVFGAAVAKKFGVKVGQWIEATHGVEGGSAHDHSHYWEVVGILKPSGTPLDDVILINLDSFYRIEDHMDGAIIPSAAAESGTEPAISAVMAFPTPKIGKALLLTGLKGRTDCQVVEVHAELRKLFQVVGNVNDIFFWVAILVVLIGIISVMVAIYNTMNERRREIAILRALGARRGTIVLVVVIEAALIAFLGGLLGLAMGHGLLALCGDVIEEAARFRPDPLTFLPVEFLVFAAVTLVGALAGLVPALKAYNTPVARNLTPLS